MLEVVIGHVGKQPILVPVRSPNHRDIVRRIIELESRQPFDHLAQRFPIELKVIEEESR
jgi:hypothetical protein